MSTSFAKVGGVIGLCAVFLVAGCGGGGSSSKTNLRFMNAVPDQSSINILLDGTSISSSLAYASESAYITASSGSRHVQSEPASASNIFFDQTITINSGTNTTLIVAGLSSTSRGIMLTDNTTAPASGHIQLRLVNGSPSLGTVDVYVVAPGTNLNTVSPNISSLGFGSSSNYLDLAAGSYEIFFTPHGSTFAFLDTGTISYTAGQNRTVVVLNNLAGGFQISTLSDLN